MTEPLEPLKPCPFCGFIFYESVSSWFNTNQGTKWGFVSCPKCAAQGPEVRTHYSEDEWWPEAIEEWNTRAD